MIDMENRGLDHRNARIYIVDDEPANLKLLVKLLRQEQFNNLTTFEDPRALFAAYDKARPDLILLDLQMPYLTGFDVLERLHDMHDPLSPPVLVLTAQHSRENLLCAFNSGARDFVSKPFDRHELLARVRNLLDAQLAQRLLHDQKSVLEILVGQRTESLHHTRLQVVQRLGRAAEYRDNETGHHIMRMSQGATCIARAIGWHDDMVELMLNASPMHDVGKIGIPDHILLKPGKLDPDEWSIMQTHCEIGANILDGDDSSLLVMARDIARSHHEKWDGTGYPDGLMGTDIPQAARIAAISDVFDALTSRRPYKAPWSVDDAVKLICDQSGKHFDPEVVSCFQHCLPNILLIRESFQES